MNMKTVMTAAVMAAALTTDAQTAYKNDTDMDRLELTKEWDKTFPKSEKVSHEKVTFRNRYGITLAADLYKPVGAETLFLYLQLRKACVTSTSPSARTASCLLWRCAVRSEP